MTGLVVMVLILIVMVLGVLCVQRQAKIESLRKELAFLKASLELLTEKQKPSAEAEEKTTALGLPDHGTVGKGNRRESP
jgi:Tfp pilus assembly protein PilN